MGKHSRNTETVSMNQVYESAAAVDRERLAIAGRLLAVETERLRMAEDDLARFLTGAR